MGSSATRRYWLSPRQRGTGQIKRIRAGEKLPQERGKTSYVPASGERITGTHRQSVELVSGKYALVERSQEFPLLPWRPVIEKELGKQSPASFATGFGGRMAGSGG